jgi:hypothetical protein
VITSGPGDDEKEKRGRYFAPFDSPIRLSPAVEAFWRHSAANTLFDDIAPFLLQVPYRATNAVAAAQRCVHANC